MRTCGKVLPACQTMMYQCSRSSSCSSQGFSCFSVLLQGQVYCESRCLMLVVQLVHRLEIGMRHVGAPCEPAHLLHGFRVPRKY